MKRFRILNMQFDTRAKILQVEIQADWEPHVRASWEENQARVEQSLVIDYGIARHNQKGADFLAAGDLPFSVEAFHNKFLVQARDAFVLGAYYPALTAACALGERILNRLILLLRDDFSGTPEYKRVFTKRSFSNWDLAIDALEAWSVLLPGAVEQFRKLRDLRHRSLHFQPETDTDDRDLALEGLSILKSIIGLQFSAFFGGAPWFVPNELGLPFIKREFEAVPFVKKVILPSCVRVGPNHQFENTGNGFKVVDDEHYPDHEIDDAEFIRLFVEARAGRH